MKTHQQIYIDASAINQDKIINIVKGFCAASESWEYLPIESSSYQRDSEQLSCCIEDKHKNGIVSSFIAITKMKGAVFYIPNIVPRGNSTISIEDYNHIAKRFGMEFRQFLRISRLPITVKIPRPITRINHIITAGLARKKFLSFIAAYPLCFHPSDIERLDRFTCLFHRYSRSALNLSALEQYLKEDEGWAEQDASWCCDRIRTGLDVISVYRNI